MLGRKVRLITKLWEFMKQKLKQTPGVKNSTRRKKGIIPQTKLKSMS